MLLNIYSINTIKYLQYFVLFHQSYCFQRYIDTRFVVRNYFFFPPFRVFFFAAVFGFAPDGLAALGFFATTFLTGFFLGAAFVLVVFLTPLRGAVLAAAFFFASALALGILATRFISSS